MHGEYDHTPPRSETVWGQLPFAQIWCVHRPHSPRLICGHTRQDFFLKHPNYEMSINKLLGWLQYILTELEDVSPQPSISTIRLICHERIYLIWDMRLDHQLVHHPVFEHHAVLSLLIFFTFGSLPVAFFYCDRTASQSMQKWLVDWVQVDDISHGCHRSILCSV